MPGYEYMSVTLGTHSTVIVLGLRRDIPSIKDPSIMDRHEFWYSSQHETLHTVNGRIHRALGFTVEWRSQEAFPPAWAEVQMARHEVPWSRVLDIMPGYRYGQVDHLWIKPVAEPTSLPQGVPAHADWFEEAVVSQTPEGLPWEFRQRFAVLNGKVAFSEQCLAPKICLSLRPLGFRP